MKTDPLVHQFCGVVASAYVEWLLAKPGRVSEICAEARKEKGHRNHRRRIPVGKRRY